MPKKKDRIIIDTNLWISFLLTKKFYKLDRLIKDRHLILLFSQALLDEFIEVAQRPKFRKYFPLNDLEHIMIDVESKAEFINVTSDINICRDPKDNFLLSLAKDGNATHLVTGDHDLLELKRLGITKIITIADYLAKK